MTKSEVRLLFLFGVGHLYPLGGGVGNRTRVLASSQQQSFTCVGSAVKPIVQSLSGVRHYQSHRSARSCFSQEPNQGIPS